MSFAVLNTELLAFFILSLHSVDAELLITFIKYWDLLSLLSFQPVSYQHCDRPSLHIYQSGKFTGEGCSNVKTLASAAESLDPIPKMGESQVELMLTHITERL